jgi:hypothetical protein
MPPVSAFPSVLNDLAGQLRAKAQKQRDEHLVEITKLDQLIKSLEAVTGPQVEVTVDIQSGSLDSLPSMVNNAIAQAISPMPLRQQLLQLVRENGVVAVADIPALIRSKGWRTDFDNDSIKSQASALIRGNPKLFKRPSRGQFTLTSDNGTEATIKARGLNKKPLIEYSFDALSKTAKRKLHVKDMATYVEAQGYVSHAKSCPLSTLITQVITKDRRFVRVEPGIYRLRANS